MLGKTRQEKGTTEDEMVGLNEAMGWVQETQGRTRGGSESAQEEDWERPQQNAWLAT